jgi:hypothetical protein
MIALSIDNFLFLLLIAVAALFQLLSKALTKAGRSESDETAESPKPERPAPIRRPAPESDAERIRKFLEALGQPASSTPPPPVLPRTEMAPRPLAPVQPPPVLTRRWALPREQRPKPDVPQRESPPSEQPSPVQEIAPPPPPAPAVPLFEVHEGISVELQQVPTIKTPIQPLAPSISSLVKGADFKTDIASLFASKSGLQEAILLREILGPPRGLAALEQL